MAWGGRWALGGSPSPQQPEDDGVLAYVLQKSPGGQSIAATPAPTKFFKQLPQKLGTPGRHIHSFLYPLLCLKLISSSRPHMCPCIYQPLGFQGCKCHRGAKVPSLLQDLLGVLGTYLLLLWAVSRRTTCSPSSGGLGQSSSSSTGPSPMGQSSALPASQV